MTKDYSKDLSDLPMYVTDSSLFGAIIAAWMAVLAIGGGKGSAAWRAFGEWLSDEHDFHEASLNRLAIKGLISGWASRVRGKMRYGVQNMVKKEGRIPNPAFVLDVTTGLTYADEILARMWKGEKSEVSLKLNAATNVLVDTKRKDASGNPLDPVALDLTDDKWTEDYNERVDNVYRTFIPSASDPVEMTKEDIGSMWVVEATA